MSGHGGVCLFVTVCAVFRSKSEQSCIFIGAGIQLVIFQQRSFGVSHQRMRAVLSVLYSLRRCLVVL